jgi:apolipoprotein D and lipocalin family protein
MYAILSTIFCSLSMQLAVANELPPLRIVPTVNLSRYLGKWYEIARFSNSFQKDCVEAIAEYSLIDDEKIQVINTCRRIKDGRLSSVTGIARVEDPVTHAKLKVNFVPSWLRWTGIGNGDYWIIDLDKDYTYAVVSEPSRKYLWILSRTPTMPQATYNDILKRLRDQNFEVSKLIPSR